MLGRTSRHAYYASVQPAPREQCKRDPEIGYELMQRVGYMLIPSISEQHI